MGNVIRVRPRRRAQSLDGDGRTVKGLAGAALSPDLRDVLVSTLVDKTGNAMVGSIDARREDPPVLESPSRRASIPEDLLSPTVARSRTRLASVSSAGSGAGAGSSAMDTEGGGSSKRAAGPLPWVEK